MPSGRQQEFRIPRTLLEQRLDGRHVDIDDVVDEWRVAAGQDDRDRDRSVAQRADHHPVARKESALRELQSPQRVPFVGVGTCHVHDQLRLVREHRRQRPRERGQVCLVACAVLESDVEIAPRLEQRIVVLLVDRAREDVGSRSKIMAVPLPWWTSQ